jgi:SAM-dependent methyltransferase
MIAYYAQRAAEYERVYASPRWQEDLERIRERIRAVFAGRRLFEVACGTGYWTRYAAERALGVHATDVNDDTLALARAKTYRASVAFERRDAYAPATSRARCDAGLAALWLSHVDLSRNRSAGRLRAGPTRRATATRCAGSRAASASRSSRTPLRCFWTLEYAVA